MDVGEGWSCVECELSVDRLGQGSPKSKWALFLPSGIHNGASGVCTEAGDRVSCFLCESSAKPGEGAPPLRSRFQEEKL